MKLGSLKIKNIIYTVYNDVSAKYKFNIYYFDTSVRREYPIHYDNMPLLYGTVGMWITNKCGLELQEFINKVYVS